MKIKANYFKFFLLLLFLISFSLHAEEEIKTDNQPPEMVSGIALNKNRFFRFNTGFQISFDLALQKGYENYLEYLMHVTDLNKHTIDIILSSPNESGSEILIISENVLSKKHLNIKRDSFQQGRVHFEMDFNLQMDQLTLKVGDTVFVENRLGLKPHTDYRIVLGSGNRKTGASRESSLQIMNIKTAPDLLGKTKTEDKGSNTLYWVILVIILDVIIFGFVIWRKWVRKKRKLILTPEVEHDNEDADLVYQLEKHTQKNEVDRNISAIYLFKEFQVFDRQGNEITKRFTPLLKELFLILLLYTQRDLKGISNTSLKELLWFDKGMQSANNNRAVNIGKLKNILDKVGNYEIISASQNIHIELREDIYCDYLEVLHLLQENTLNKEQIIEIVNKAGRGPFLPESNYEWLDSFKAEISEAIIDNLLGFTQLIDLKKEARLIVRIADTIFNFDNLNEKALSLKCKALISLGKHSLANATYTRFVKDYETLYLIPYGLTFYEVSHLED